MSNYPVHIVFCANNAYIPYITVVVKSIIENHTSSEVSIHLMADYVSPVNRKSLHNLLSGHENIHLFQYEVDDEVLKEVNTKTIYTWYRLLIPEVLPTSVHRVLYLDADVIVKENLAELFQLDMTGASIAATIDCLSFQDDTFLRCGYEREKQYICAGVMLMNLDYWRENHLAGEMIEWGIRNKHKLKFADQDCINYICRDTKILLPLRYAVVSALFGIDRMYDEEHIEEVRDSLSRPVVIHYAGAAPWLKDVEVHPLQCEWEKYNNMLATPVRRRYKTRGYLGLKIRVWNILHPNGRRKITMDTIRKRLENR